MHSTYTKFVKILEIYKQFTNKFVNEKKISHIVLLFLNSLIWKLSHCLLQQRQKVSIARTGYLNPLEELFQETNLYHNYTTPNILSNRP